MSREILFWIAEMGWAVTLIVYFIHIKYIQRQYFEQVNKELEHLIKLRYEVIRFINNYNSRRHSNKIVWDGDKLTLVNSLDVEPINMDAL